jgi:hypothetical protein
MGVHPLPDWCTSALLKPIMPGILGPQISTSSKPTENPFYIYFIFVIVVVVVVIIIIFK